MAVREARRRGQAVHSVVVDEDGQDWFARIFGRGGFTLMPDPARLLRAREAREHSSIFAIAKFWLAIATVAMVIMLYAVHRIVSQR